MVYKDQNVTRKLYKRLEFIALSSASSKHRLRIGMIGLRAIVFWLLGRRFSAILDEVLNRS